jgi:hypothetical protein
LLAGVVSMHPTHGWTVVCLAREGVCGEIHQFFTGGGRRRRGWLTGDMGIPHLIGVIPCAPGGTWCHRSAFGWPRRGCRQFSETVEKSKKTLYTIEVVWMLVLMTVAPVGLLNGRGVIREVAGGLGRVLSQD